MEENVHEWNGPMHRTDVLIWRIPRPWDHASFPESHYTPYSAAATAPRDARLINCPIPNTNARPTRQGNPPCRCGTRRRSVDGVFWSTSDTWFSLEGPAWLPGPPISSLRPGERAAVSHPFSEGRAVLRLDGAVSPPAGAPAPGAGCPLARRHYPRSRAPPKHRSPYNGPAPTGSTCK